MSNGCVLRCLSVRQDVFNSIFEIIVLCSSFTVNALMAVQALGFLLSLLCCENTHCIYIVMNIIAKKEESVSFYPIICAEQGQ